MRSLTAFVTLLLLSAPGRLLAEEGPIVTDRPGFLYSSATVGRGTFQAELGLPAVTLDEDGGAGLRSSILVALLRWGVAPDVELRLGAPVYTRTRVSSGRFHATDEGWGDLEAGLKWHLADGAGARPSLALVPSVILPTRQKSFSAERPVYQLNAAAEWTIAGSWGLAALGGYLNGPSAGGRYGQETFALSLGRSLPSPAWSAYGEAVHVATSLAGGVKYLVSNDLQLDLSFDRGLTGGSPDWLFGFGFAARF